MKRVHLFTALTLTISLLVSISIAQIPAQINYQGRLLDGTNLVSSDVGMVLSLYNAPGSGTMVFEDSNTVSVVDGLYSTYIGDNRTAVSGTLSDALTNDQLYVQVQVNGVNLTPRERITSVCFAQVSGGVTNDAILSKMLGDEAVSARTVDAATFSNTFWKADGNAGTSAGTHFLGTTDNEPLEIQVNNQQALRFEYQTIGPRIIGGNFSDAGGAASTVGGGYNNTAATNYATVAGGRFSSLRSTKWVS